MDLRDLNNLEFDFENIGNWPKSTKVVFIAAVCVFILVLGYFLDISDQMDNLSAAKQREDTLKHTFEVKQQKASNLAVYQDQMKEIERSFGSLLRQLPGKTEVADLLTDISQTGLGAGLEFELFKPEAENPVDFYAELPIKIRVRGKYHEMGNFVSGVASLPRIVTMHDFTIESKKPDGTELVMETTAKTYRYLEDGENAQVAQVSKK